MMRRDVMAVGLRAWSRTRPRATAEPRAPIEGGNAGIQQLRRQPRHRARAIPRPNRTCARSPNICTPATPGRRQDVRRPAIVGDHFEQRPGQRARSASGRSSASSRPSCSSATRRAAFGLVQIRRGHHDGDPLRRGTRRAVSRTRAATPDRRRSSARRARSASARGPACRPARASVSCRPTADRPVASRNGVSWVISSRRSRRPGSRARRGSRRRRRCSRRH